MSRVLMISSVATLAMGSAGAMLGQLPGLLAGIGNILATEALWYARIDVDELMTEIRRQADSKDQKANVKRMEANVARIASKSNSVFISPTYWVTGSTTSIVVEELVQATKDVVRASGLPSSALFPA